MNIEITVYLILIVMILDFSHRCYKTILTNRKLSPEELEIFNRNWD